jgi:hypothetical protein
VSGSGAANGVGARISVQRYGEVPLVRRRIPANPSRAICNILRRIRLGSAAAVASGSRGSRMVACSYLGLPALSPVPYHEANGPSSHCR